MRIAVGTRKFSHSHAAMPFNAVVLHTDLLQPQTAHVVLRTRSKVAANAVQPTGACLQLKTHDKWNPEEHGRTGVLRLGIQQVAHLDLLDCALVVQAAHHFGARFALRIIP